MYCPGNGGVSAEGNADAMHTVITYSIAGSRLAGLSLKSATEEHERQEDFQTWADSLVRSAPRKRRRRTGAKASWECGCKKSRTEKKHKVDSARHVHDEQDRARRAALARKERKKAGTSEVPDMGLEQKGKTVEAKRSSRYGARTHDFFACGGPGTGRDTLSSHASLKT